MGGIGIWWCLGRVSHSCSFVPPSRPLNHTHRVSRFKVSAVHNRPLPCPHPAAGGEGVHPQACWPPPRPHPYTHCWLNPPLITQIFVFGTRSTQPGCSKQKFPPANCLFLKLGEQQTGRPSGQSAVSKTWTFPGISGSRVLD